VRSIGVVAGDKVVESGLLLQHVPRRGLRGFSFQRLEATAQDKEIARSAEEMSKTVSKMSAALP
jgi:hypothetical protein